MPDRAGARFAEHDAQGKPGCPGCPDCRPVMLPMQARGPIARLLLSGCASGKGRRRGGALNVLRKTGCGNAHRTWIVRDDLAVRGFGTPRG